MGSEAQRKLVIFDVEGIVVPKRRFMLFEIAGKMGIGPFMKAVFLGLLYEIGLISLKHALQGIYGLFKGLSLKRFMSLFGGLPLMPRVEFVFDDLKKAGFEIAMISSSIPRIALEQLGRNLEADYVSGLEIGLSEGFLTGQIWGDVIEPEGKAVALQKILNNGPPLPYHCVAVADDRNNLPLFQICHLGIGYNPDFLLGWRSDHVVKGKLSNILPLVKGERMASESRGLSETAIFRELIHTGGFFVSLVCVYLVNRYIAASLIFLVTALYSVSETWRMFGARLPIVTGITSKATGESEFQEFVASPIFYALGIIMSILLFPEPICYVSITVLTLGDGFAALLGERFGKRRVPFNKTKNLEGTLGGFLVAFLGSLLFASPAQALVASGVGMLAEILPLPWDDNLTIPLASGLALALASAASL